MNRRTKRALRLAARGAPTLVVMAIAASIHSSSCLGPDCVELHRCGGAAAGTASPETPETPDPPDPPDPPVPPDPEEAKCMPRENPDGVDDACGVFVSARGGASNVAGTKEEPLRSLQQAIDLAKQNGTGRVYACAGDGEDFNEAVVVPGGVAIYGGLDCSDGWKWVDDETKTNLTADEGKIPLTMRGLPRTVHIEDLHVVAQPTTQQDDKGAGVSSIAAIAHSTSVELVRCVLEAGPAAAGADGAPHEGNAPPGLAGQQGNYACSGAYEAPVAGGSAVINECGTPDDLGDDSSGGSGGDGLLMIGTTGDNGTPLFTASGDMENRGNGHDGLTTCTIGRPGSNRAESPPGAGAVGTGSISVAGYAGVAGGDGVRGVPGQGGGGGGGARGVADTEGNRYCPSRRERRGGASGGSGGAGGCGGLGGKGGLPGGSSIALISLDAALSFDDVILRVGNGADGGKGGPGQPGGEGGAGGPGGKVPDGAAGLFPACEGGKGGTGGTGGKGGGGQGGHSLGIAFRGTAPSTDGITAVELGAPGTGGQESTANGSGASGVADTTLEFN
ncbi:PGRS family protein [Sorangium sp. So ce385]|uniref:PGRS family protein n=1 Tax=Sorangium sp. So ce385 TaxID=3133308 RepID=UPI003F5B2B1E